MPTKLGYNEEKQFELQGLNFENMDVLDMFPCTFDKERYYIIGTSVTSLKNKIILCLRVRMTKKLCETIKPLLLHSSGPEMVFVTININKDLKLLESDRLVDTGPKTCKSCGTCLEFSFEQVSETACCFCKYDVK